jgi:hypothetical protein
LNEIASGAELRPGDRLSSFAIDWVVLEGPLFVLDDVLVAQLDLVPIPLDPVARVFENKMSSPIAGTVAEPWAQSGLVFVGERVDGPVGIAVNHDDGWQPDAARSAWFVRIDGSDGIATFAAPGSNLALSALSIASMLGALVLILIGRRRT